MICTIVKEIAGETRVAASPESVVKLTALGLDVVIEKGLGEHLCWSDEQYSESGARILSREEALKEGDLHLMLQPNEANLDCMKKGALVIAFLDPMRRPELLEKLNKNNLNSISVELIPRSTYAQKMDALSSQASLAGYGAVIKSADYLQSILPMMTTPSGTIKPARVFIIGVGVAGLQAIATAKRLGARVEAFDTRPEVAEQVSSLGAKFVSIDLGETGQDENGYALALTAEQLDIQKKAMEAVCIQSDVVITTALLFGRPAPQLISAETVAKMKPGSVIFDMAAANGGNVEGTVCDKITTTANGVSIIAPENGARYYPVNSSSMYASNLVALLTDAIKKKEEAEELYIDMENEIVKSCVVNYGGETVHKMLKGDAS